MALTGGVAPPIVNQQNEGSDPNQRDREADDEDRIEAIGHRGQDPEGQ